MNSERFSALLSFDTKSGRNGLFPNGLPAGSYLVTLEEIRIIVKGDPLATITVAVAEAPSIST